MEHDEYTVNADNFATSFEAEPREQKDFTGKAEPFRTSAGKAEMETDQTKEPQTGRARLRLSGLRKTRSVVQFTSSDVKTAPFIAVSTELIFSTFRVSCAIHTIVLSASFSAEVISTL